MDTRSATSGAGRLLVARYEALGRARRLLWAMSLVSVVALFAALLTTGEPDRGQSMAVPAYFYAGPYWIQMERARPVLQLAVMNPASGPGAAPDPQYVTTVRAAQATGITVVGYVHTSDAARSLSAVESDVNAYYRWYAVNGIFFDEASTNCADASYYAKLNSFVKAKGGIARTILNPGTQTNECYLPVADILLTFEGSDTQYVNSYSAPSWVARYSPTHFWHVIYGASTVSAMTHAIQLSKRRGAGFVYVTSATLQNPYSVLPRGLYWSKELAGIR
jgi:hypothetical protein